MTIDEIKLIGLSFLLIALLYILNLNYHLGYALPLISSLVFGLLAVYLVYKSFSTDRRSILIWNTIIFCTSTLIFITQYFRVNNISQLIIPSILFCGGLVFLMLFIQNSINRSLIYASITFFVLFGLSVFFRNTLFMNKINILLELLLSYKIILIFLLSAFLIWNKQIKY